MMDGVILVLNAGSSSLKFAAFDASDGTVSPRVAGQVEGIGAQPRFTAKDAEGRRIAEQGWQGGGAGPPQAPWQAAGGDNAPGISSVGFGAADGLELLSHRRVKRQQPRVG